MNTLEHVHPLQMAREIQDRYHGYLKTSFYFRDPELRRSFEAWSAPRISAHLRS